MAVNYVYKGTATVGTRHKVATYQETISSEVVEIQRIAISGPAGEELGSSSAQVAPASFILDTGGTPEIAVAAGAKVGWLIINVSGATIYLGFHSSVSTSNGIPIFNNSSYQQNGPGIFTGNVYCVAAGNTRELRVQTW